MTKAKALATTLAALGLTGQTMNYLVFTFFWHFKEEWPKEAGMLNSLYESKELRNLRADLAGKVSVADILRMFADCERIRIENNELPRLPMRFQMFRNFSQKLVGLGLTRLDWILLPQSTMTSVKLSKGQWLEQPIVLLGTLSGIATRRLVDNNQVTLVKQLLVLDVAELRGSRDLYRSFRKTQEKLHEIGFTREDGVFMRAYSRPTKSEVVKEVIVRGGLTRRQATNFVRTAAKVGRYDDLWSWE